MLAKLAELTGRPGPDPTLVRLTPLALRALNRMLRAEGADAPILGELATAPLDVLCAQAIRANGGIAGALTAAWLVERDETAAETLTAEEMCLGMTDHLAAMDELGARRTIRSGFTWST
ncbi:hypothetical protein [Amycolatopsis sp. CA-128772]|uniref:hypothetical protein n=1 Tax=Amycolatopsis sp. CA-128772 TaxID=2073159 RepID=UPI001E50875C|nr:hypothetical protein [Amycolatopsis sp. CA-128772]